MPSVGPLVPFTSTHGGQEDPSETASSIDDLQILT